MHISRTARALTRRGFVNLNPSGPFPVYTKLSQRGTWMCGVAVALTPRGAVVFRQKTCLRKALRHVASQAAVGDTVTDYVLQKQPVASGAGIMEAQSTPVVVYDNPHVSSRGGPMELVGDHGLEDTSIITEGWYSNLEDDDDEDDEVGSRASRRRRRARRKARRARARARRKAKRRARKARASRRRAKRRARSRSRRKRFKRRLHKIAKRLAKSKVLKGLRKGWSKLLKSPLAQKVIQAGAKALSAFGVPPAATRALLTQMKNNAIKRMDEGGLPAMLARASHKDAKRGSFFREMGKRQLSVLPASLMAALPMSGLTGKMSGKLGSLGGALGKKLRSLPKGKMRELARKLAKRKLSRLVKKFGAKKTLAAFLKRAGPKAKRAFRRRLMALAPGGKGGGKNIQAIMRKMGKKRLLALAKNLGGGKLSKRQLIKLALSMRKGKVGLKQLRALKKLRKVRHSKAVVSLAMRRRRKKRGRSHISNVRRAALRRMLRSSKGRRKLQRALVPRGKRRRLLSHANPKVRVRVSGEEFLGAPGYENPYRF